MIRLQEEQIGKIVQLRKTGHSLPEIRKLTGHSSSTVLKYIQGVDIKPEFRESWKRKQKTSIRRSEKEWEKATQEARKLLRNIDREGRILLATSLYWAEGAKKDFALINSDPHLLKIFIESLSEFGILRKDLTLSLRLYSDINIREAVKFWSKVTGIPDSQVSYITMVKGKKNGKLKYGMCRVRIKKGGYVLKLFDQLRRRIVELSP